MCLFVCDLYVHSVLTLCEMVGVCVCVGNVDAVEHYVQV